MADTPIEQMQNQTDKELQQSLNAGQAAGTTSTAAVEGQQAPQQQSAQSMPQPQLQGQQQQTMDEGQQAAATDYSQAGGKYAQGPTTPAQKHAGIFHSIMETLAGPQARRKIVDPNTGQIIDDPTQPRRSTGQLANSIVAGALTGLFAGAGTSKMEGGLVAMGKGYNARQAQIQQQQQQAKQEATDALTRQQAMAEHNFRVHQLGVATANLDMDFNNKVNESGKQLHDEQEDNGMILQDHIREEDIPALMKKYNITKDMFMRSPEKSYPLVGPDGKPTNQVGNFYYVLKPGAKAHVTESDIADFNKAGIHDFDKVSPDQEVDIHALSLAKNRVNMLKAVGALGDSHKTAAGTGETSVVPSAPAAKITADTPIKGIDPNIVADTITKNEASTYKNNPGALKFANQPGAILGPNGFAIFPTPEAGRQALLNDNAAKLKANPDMTISQLINKRTPVGSENTQAQVDTQVKNLIAAAQGAQAPATTAKKKEVADEDLYSSKLSEAAKNGEISNEMLKVLTNFTLSREPLDAVKAMHANAVPEQYINKFVELHGGMDAMRQREDDYKLAQEKAKKESDTAISEASVGRKEQREAELEKQNEVYLQRPSDAWRLQDAIPNHKAMDSLDLENSLKKQGVKIPPIMDYLTRVARYQESPSSVPTIIRKGTFQMSRQQAMDYIGKFINPDYDVRKYEESNTFAKDLGKQTPNTSGGLVQAAGTAAQHIGDLEKATEALNNGNIQVLNSLANKWGVATGKSAPVVFNAIAHKVMTETEKVAYGGTPLENSLQDLKNDLNIRESKGQLAGASDAYIGLMADRLNELDNKSLDLMGQHLKLSKAATRMFADHGYTFGPDGLTKGNTQQSNLPKFTPGATLTPDIVQQYAKANGNDPVKTKQALIDAKWPTQ